MEDIAIVCGAGIVSGKEVMVLELSDGLLAKGTRVTCITSWWGEADFRLQLNALGVVTHVLRLGFISATLTPECIRMTGHQLWYWPGLLFKYRRLLRRIKPHKIVHTNWHHLLLLLPLLVPKRDLFWVHEVIPNKPQYRKVFGWLERRLQCFVPISRAVERSLQTIGVSGNKIHMVYNGIANPVRGTGPVLPDGDRITIGIVGQVGAWKGHDDLFEAFAVLSPSFPSAELHVFGKGTTEYEKHLEQKATRLGVTERVTWHGFIADRSQIYRGMDVCVVPSHFEEPLGLVAIEAALCGIPVIATRQGGLPEIVQDGVTGLLVEAGQPAELALQLRTLLADAELRETLGLQAKSTAERKFGHDRFIGDFTCLLSLR